MAAARVQSSRFREILYEPLVLWVVERSRWRAVERTDAAETVDGDAHGSLGGGVDGGSLQVEGDDAQRSATVDERCACAIRNARLVGLVDSGVIPMTHLDGLAALEAGGLAAELNLRGGKRGERSARGERWRSYPSRSVAWSGRCAFPGAIVADRAFFCATCFGADCAFGTRRPVSRSARRDAPRPASETHLEGGGGSGESSHCSLSMWKVLWCVYESGDLPFSVTDTGKTGSRDQTRQLSKEIEFCLVSGTDWDRWPDRCHLDF